MQRLAAAAILSGLGSLACAHQPEVFGSNVSYAFTWTEVNPVGAPNNILEPGEGARISLALTMSPASGSPIMWNPEIGGSGSGDLRAVGLFWFNLVGVGGTQGTWSQLQIHEFYDFGGPSYYGTPGMSGSTLTDVAGGQLPLSQTFVLTTNPIVGVWSGTWTPTSYAPRTVTFASENGTGNPNPLASTVIVRDPMISHSVIHGTSDVTHGSVAIPIIPAPPSISIVGIAGLLGQRRQR